MITSPPTNSCVTRYPPFAATEWQTRQPWPPEPADAYPATRFGVEVPMFTPSVAAPKLAPPSVLAKFFTRLVPYEL